MQDKELDDTQKQVESKGEIGISEWVYGSKASWTNEFDKSSLFYWSHIGADTYMRIFQQCYVISLIQMKLTVNHCQWWIQAVYSPSPNAGQIFDSKDSLMLVYSAHGD